MLKTFCFLKVGSMTTSEHVECRSNHLTWFGSRVFVPPNKLDLDIIASRISDPSNYAPVLSVLCVTFGLYFLVVIWARRQDRKDKNKVLVEDRKLNQLFCVKLL